MSVAFGSDAVEETGHVEEGVSAYVGVWVCGCVGVWVSGQAAAAGRGE